MDTNVISAADPTKAATAPALIAWMDEQSTALYLSAISIAEIETGIAGLRRRQAHRRADHLTAWLEMLLHLYGDRVLPFDCHVARIAGVLADEVRSLGQSPGFADIAIAATARHHQLTILTRNTRHFEPLGVPFLDPFDELPSSPSTRP